MSPNPVQVGERRVFFVRWKPKQIAHKVHLPGSKTVSGIFVLLGKATRHRPLLIDPLLAFPLTSPDFCISRRLQPNNQTKPWPATPPCLSFLLPPWRLADVRPSLRPLPLPSVPPRQRRGHSDSAAPMAAGGDDNDFDDFSSKVCFMFPGQGAQFVGMCCETSMK